MFQIVSPIPILDNLNFYTVALMMFEDIVTMIIVHERITKVLTTSVALLPLLLYKECW